MSLIYFSKIIIAILAIIMSAIISVLFDWLLKLVLPTKPGLKHIIAGLMGCVVLAFFIALLQTQASTPPANNNLQQSSATNLIQTPDINLALALIGNNKRIIESKYADLDGAGLDELIIRWEYIVLNEEINLGGVEVFKLNKDNQWENILHLTGLEHTCGPYWGEFGLVNLFKDQSRQLVTWMQCGTGAFLSLEIYRYQGLDFMEQIYSSPDPSLESEIPSWMESGPLVVNEELFIVHSIDLYKYTWKNGNITGEKVDLDLGANSIKVDIKVDQTGAPIADPNVVKLKIGQYLYFKKAGIGEFPGDFRIQYDAPDILEVKNFLIFYAKKVGVCNIFVWGWAENPLVVVEVIQ